MVALAGPDVWAAAVPVTVSDVAARAMAGSATSRRRRDPDCGDVFMPLQFSGMGREESAGALYRCDVHRTDLTCVKLNQKDNERQGWASPVAVQLLRPHPTDRCDAGGTSRAVPVRNDGG
ncbi:hypothetical protein GCM10027259_50570 [Micromonospora palomenae]